MAMARNPARRRRARRGSLERPINARLYRGSLLILTLPLLILAFSITRPAALSAPLLPPNFDGPATRQLATDFSTRFPDRVPGGPGSLTAGQWFRDQLAPYGLPVSSDTWNAQVPGLGRVRLRNLWAVAGGESSDAIVVMAHRDDTGTGPGRQRRRQRHGRPGRAGPRLRPGGHSGRPARALRAHDRLSLHGRRLVRRARRAPVRPALTVPRRRDDQPGRDRRPRASADRDRRGPAPLAGGLARRDSREARARTDRNAACITPGRSSS